MLRLYYWDSVKALAEARLGYAFALATSKGEAIESVVQAYVTDHPPDGRIKHIYAAAARELKQELWDTEPAHVLATTAGFYIYGSE